MAIRISSLNHRLQVPQNSLSDDLHLKERRWFAVRVSSKHEKRAVKELIRLGIEAWIPLRERNYHYASKKVVRELPLLSGYVFVNIKQAEEKLVRCAHYVARFVTIGKVRRQVLPAEMDVLRRISSDRTLDWETLENVFAFEEGMPVEIIRGPLAGIRGHYIKKKNKKTFVIALGSLNACLATCEVDPRYLVALEGVSNGQKTGWESGIEGKKTLW